MKVLDDERGFSLIELIVVLIILGVLAGMAIPVLLLQRAKARDTSTRADVNTLAKEVATYFVDGDGLITLDFVSYPGAVVLRDGTGWSATVRLTNGTVAPTTGSGRNLGSATDWCVSLTDPLGHDRTYKYEARNGLDLGSCS